MTRHVQLVELGTPARLLAEAARWFSDLSGGHCTIAFNEPALVQSAKSLRHYAAGIGGKGAWPRNSQALLVDSLPSDLLSGCTLAVFAPSDLLPHTWHLPRGYGDSRYAVFPEGCSFGAVVHELGHLLFHWPDWRWPRTCEMECLMARGGLLQPPAPASAPLLVQEGWRTPIPVGRTTLVGDLAGGTVGAVDWSGKQVLTEWRCDGGESRLMIYVDAESGAVERIALRQADEECSVLGLAAPTLRRAMASQR